MTTIADELLQARYTPSLEYQFEPRLLEQADAQGKLGLNAHLLYQHNQGERWLVKIEVDPKIDWQGHLPYAFQFLPPIKRDPATIFIPSKREYAIIRIVAAPGVKVLVEPPKRVGVFEKVEDLILSKVTPRVEIIRVQDVGLIPPLGRDILTYSYVYTTWNDPDPDPTVDFKLLPRNHVLIDQKREGVDFVQEAFNLKLQVRVKPFGKESHQDRFLYKFSGGTEEPLLFLMTTASTKVEFQETFQFAFEKNKLNFLQQGARDPARLKVKHIVIPNLYMFNLLATLFYGDGFDNYDLEHFARKTTLTPKHVPSKDAILRILAVDLAIGVTPIVGDIYDIAQFAYALVFKEDFHGSAVSNADLVVMGLCAALPFVPGAAAKGLKHGKQLLKTFGQKADIVEDLADGLKLAAREKALLEEATEYLAQGRKIPDKLVKEITETVRLPQSKLHVLDDLLDASKANFTNSKLQEKYQAYLAVYRKKAEKITQGGGKAEPPLTPEAWAKKTRSPEAMKILEDLLGKDFRKVRKTAASGKFATINAADVIRPTSLDNARLEKLVRSILDEPELLLNKVPLVKVVDGKIAKNLFSTIQGAVGEILAREHKNAILAARRGEAVAKRFSDSIKAAEGGKVFKDAELFENVRIMTKNADGSWSHAKEFTDGIVGGVNKNGDFVLTDVIEIKAGDAVAKKVQNQIFEWVEDRISEGARIVLPDGRTFDYFPTDPNVKRVIGLARAERHIINPAGKSHLGMNSGDQIAAAVSRSDLPASDEEIKFITALIQNTKEVPLGPTSAELDYLVAELSKMISGYSSSI